MLDVRLHFVRHAPVIGQEGIAYGRDANIDESCHDKFNAAASMLPRGCPLWITSEYPRAIKTALRLQETLFVRHPIHAMAEFNEQDFGALIGQRKSSIAKNPDNAAFLADMGNVAPPGGESVPQMNARVREGLEYLIERMRGQGRNEAIIVCHGGVIRAAAGLCLNQPFNLKMKVPHLSVHTLDPAALRL